jgi:lipoprotein-anchoring transpeptidase ErfK/SrfK
LLSLLCASLAVLLSPAVFPDAVHRGYPVYADVIESADLRKDRRETAEIIGKLPSGAIVEIVMDYSAKWYYVDEPDSGVKGWTERARLNIPPDEPAEKSVLPHNQLEEYVNAAGLASDTPFLVYADLWRQRVHVFNGKQSEWRHVQTFVCASGRNESPTVRGVFITSESGIWFYSDRLGSGGKYWIRFNDTYLFHSVSMDASRKILDPTLGERVSNGCIRLSVADAEWLYLNLPVGTTVFIN